jgi:ABC-type phosphate transport system permease subunit
MSRANITIITSIAILLLILGAFSTSHLWFTGSDEKDFGAGVIVVGTFFLMHLAVTIALVWATLSATMMWRRSMAQRKMIDSIILLAGIIASTASSAYTVFFMVG